MDVESQETLKVTIETAQTALTAVLQDTFVKLEAVIRDSLAETVSALDGWELTISPITIQLKRSLK